MLERASGQFTIEGNVEDIFGGVSGATRIARISQTCLFTGSLQGESIAEYTAVLPREGGGSFQGFQRISGALGEREGTFVVCVTGEYAKGQPRGSWTIVPKSGSGDFVHIRGGGEFSQPAGKAGRYMLEFDLRKPRRSREVGVAVESTPGELIPGIDIVVDDPPAPETEPIATAALDAASTEKPGRRPRRKATVAKPSDSEPVAAEPKSESRRARKKADAAVSADAPADTPEPVRKRSRARAEATPDQVSSKAKSEAGSPPRARSRKTEMPESAGGNPAVAETGTNRRRKQRESPAGQSEPETKAPTSPAQKRGRKTLTEAVVPAADEAAPKRRRKPAEPKVAEPAAADPAPVAEPKPGRRKNASAPPAQPLPLPVAEDKPVRQRRAKAA